MMIEDGFILLDIGSTSLKSSIIETSNTSLQEVNVASTPPFISEDSIIREISPSELMSRCDRLIAQVGEGVRKVHGILITGQMGGWMLTDSKNQPLMNLVSWQDTRGTLAKDGSQSSFESLRQDHEPYLNARNGGEFRPSLAFVGLHHQLNHSGASEQQQRFHSIISWVGSQLVSDYQFMAHATDAAASGFLDISSNTWLSGAVDLLPTGLELPEVFTSLESLGLHPRLGCPVYTPVGDQQSSLKGIELGASEIALNVGTGAQIARLSHGERTTGSQLRPYFGGEFIETKTHLPGGRTIAMFLDLVVGREATSSDYEWMNQQITLLPRSESIDVKNPGREVDRLKRAGFEDSAQLAADILWAIADVFAIEIKRMDPHYEQNLVIAGGIGSRMRNIFTTVGELIGRPVTFSDAKETTLQGLAYLSKGLPSC